MTALFGVIGFHWGTPLATIIEFERHPAHDWTYRWYGVSLTRNCGLGFIVRHAKVNSVIPAVPRYPAMSEEEAERQRRSFTYGNTAMSNTDVTRELVDEVADATGREPVMKTKERLAGELLALPMVGATVAQMQRIAEDFVERVQHDAWDQGRRDQRAFDDADLLHETSSGRAHAPGEPVFPGISAPCTGAHMKTAKVLLQEALRATPEQMELYLSEGSGMALRLGAALTMLETAQRDAWGQGVAYGIASHEDLRGTKPMFPGER